MASTYSDRLRIELMGAGDQSGTWGTTTNTNLGTLIEESIAGLSTIAMGDANQTLTAQDGATDQARKMILKLTGTLTATRQVIVPQKEKLYVVHNAATGGKVHVKTSAATGVEVSPGLKTVVYCDGTNVVSVLPQALNESTTTNNILSYNGTTWVAADVNTLVTSFSSGMILNWAGNIASPPSGWLVCDGTAVSRSTYASLFSAISTAFGVGDGSSTFNVPDMRDKFVIGAGSTYNVAATGGSADAVIVSHSHTLSGNTNTAGSHNHLMFRNNPATSNETNGTVNQYASRRTNYGSSNYNYSISPTNNAADAYRTSQHNGHAHGLSGNTSTVGNSATGANLPPYVAVGFIIKT